MLSSDPVTFEYRFNFDDGHARTFEVRLDPATLRLLREPQVDAPDWTRLDFFQCPTCPLTDREACCPVALNLSTVLDYFKDRVSHEEVEVEVETEARVYRKRTPLQDAVSSLVGIHMVTSGCPILGKLKPMVATHLPFATLEETTYRAVSTYLLAQFLRARRGMIPDWDLTGLASLYEEIEAVNASFFERVKEAQQEDAGLNALVHLDCFARFASFILSEADLEEWEGHFDAHLEPALA
jgi:hypothetical protein